ncbi:MAG TPA: hypothetical protein VKC34_07755 [Blastocatellia bacterium]|nr:hypothetical protein [Blastocatellia bacterium]
MRNPHDWIEWTAPDPRPLPLMNFSRSQQIGAVILLALVVTLSYYRSC